MAFKYLKKKTIRRKRRFLKRKGAKTYRRSRKGIMSGGNETWNVNVYYFDTTINYGDSPVPSTPLPSTPGIFTVIHRYGDDKSFLFGNLILPDFNNKIFTGKFIFLTKQNIYMPDGMMVINERNPRLMINNFEKVELSTGTPYFPTSDSSLKTPLLLKPTPSKSRWRWPFFKNPDSQTNNGRL